MEVAKEWEEENQDGQEQDNSFDKPTAVNATVKLVQDAFSQFAKNQSGKRMGGHNQSNYGKKVNDTIINLL